MASSHDPYLPKPPADSFCSLLYRFFFFDWLFADLDRAQTLLERHAAWRHNREMRKYLPTYLRRWSCMGSTAFVAGSLCERVWEAQIAASCCFTGFGVTLAVMAVIVVCWLFLARPAAV